MNCKFYNNGYCKNIGQHALCKPTTINMCDEKLTTINPEEMCQHSSKYGNGFFIITKEQLEDLRNGKVLYAIDEYGTFIALENNLIEKEEKHECSR